MVLRNGLRHVPVLQAEYVEREKAIICHPTPRASSGPIRMAMRRVMRREHTVYNNNNIIMVIINISS